MDILLIPGTIITSLLPLFSNVFETVVSHKLSVSWTRLFAELSAIHIASASFYGILTSCHLTLKFGCTRWLLDQFTWSCWTFPKLSTEFGTRVFPSSSSFGLHPARIVHRVSDDLQFSIFKYTINKLDLVWTISTLISFEVYLFDGMYAFMIQRDIQDGLSQPGRGPTTFSSLRSWRLIWDQSSVRKVNRNIIDPNKLVSPQSLSAVIWSGSR